MVKRLLPILFAMLTLASCVKEPPYLSVSPTSLEASPEGGDVSFRIETNAKVRFALSSEAVGWVQGPGSDFSAGEVRFQVSANDTYDPRSCTVTFSTVDGSLSQRVRISQPANTDILPEKDAYHLDGNAGTLLIPVETNVSFEATVSVDWIVPDRTRGLQSEILSFSVSENPGDPREGKIFLEGDGIKRTISVLQETKGVIFIEPEYVVPGEEGPFSIDLSANVPFSVETDQSWITFDGTRSFSDRKAAFRLQANTTDGIRTAAVRFLGSLGELISETVIVQLARDRGLSFQIHGDSWVSPSFDEDRPLYWMVDWGDGSSLTAGKADSHRYPDAGPHTVWIPVTGADLFTVSVNGLDTIDISKF